MRPQAIPQVPAADPHPRAHRAKARSTRPWLLFSLGVSGAILAAELGLRLLTTPLDNEWDPIGADKVGAEVREIRRFTEGIAASHFTRARARLTGNPPIAGTTTGVILGDSYVEAVQVPDRETMGAVLERSLRAAGQSINVRQYGWPGVDIPQYVLVAPEVTRMWDPAWVVVVMTANDLGPDLLTGRVRLVKGPDGRWGATADSVAGRTSRLRRVGETALAQSVLLYHLSKRAQEAGLPLTGAANAGRDGGGPSSMQPGGLPLPQRALVSLAALRDAYGDRLRVLFVSNVGLDGRRERSPAEEAILEACASLGVRCANTRALMTHDRLDSLRVSRGFINSQPGDGHINAVGHALAAETILGDLPAP
jgi:hypothetical protein